MLKPDHELLAHLIEQILAEYPDGMAIYRFGSWGTAANQRRDSDIDIALLAARPISAISLWELSQRLAQLGIGKINALFWGKGKC
jgi:predicted nucleotidyltransferase